MQQPRRVLLEVRARDANLDRALRGLDGKSAVCRQRQVVLRDLVALGQVRVEVVLAVPARHVGRRRLDRHARGEDVLHGALVDTGSAPGRPRHTGHVFVFGGAPRTSVEHEQNILDAVLSWTWISMPTTTS